MQFFEDLELEQEQLRDGDSSCFLESQVVEVNVVVKLHREDEAG